MSDPKRHAMRPTHGGVVVVGGYRGPGVFPLDLRDRFHAALASSLGDLARDGEAGEAGSGGDVLWRALTNVWWQHPDEQPRIYSFRAAADVVCALRGEGTYMDWAFGGPPWGEVADVVSQALAPLGWTHRPDDTLPRKLSGGHP